MGAASTVRDIVGRIVKINDLLTKSHVVVSMHGWSGASSAIDIVEA